MNIDEKKYNNIMKFLNSIKSDYINLFTKEEINILSNINLENYKTYINLLDQFSKRIWENELSSNNYLVITWNKYSEFNKKEVTFATLSTKDEIVSFCDLNEGYICDIDYDAIISLCSKDGATVLKDNKDDYTVCKINDHYYSSYNLSSLYVTPIQMMNEYKDSNYTTKYNEILIDTSKIKKYTEFNKLCYKYNFDKKI